MVAISVCTKKYLELWVTFVNPILFQINEGVERLTFPWDSLKIDDPEVLDIHSWVNKRKGLIIINLLTRSDLLIFSVSFENSTILEAVYPLTEVIQRDYSLNWD
jgi:hypothetical protein